VDDSFNCLTISTVLKENEFIQTQETRTRTPIKNPQPRVERRTDGSLVDRHEYHCDVEEIVPGDEWRKRIEEGKEMPACPPDIDN